MTTLASADAKAHFSELLERASKGEEIVITKRGVPFVKVVSVDERSDFQKRKDFLRNLEGFRRGKKSLRGEGETWNEIGREGQRW